MVMVYGRADSIDLLKWLLVMSILIQGVYIIGTLFVFVFTIFHYLKFFIAWIIVLCFFNNLQLFLRMFTMYFFVNVGKCMKKLVFKTPKEYIDVLQ